MDKDQVKKEMAEAQLRLTKFMPGAGRYNIHSVDFHQGCLVVQGENEESLAYARRDLAVFSAAKFPDLIFDSMAYDLSLQLGIYGPLEDAAVKRLEAVHQAKLKSITWRPGCGR